MTPEIKNLEKAATRIKGAIKRKEKIIIYGDADLDGVTSVIILKETIKNLGGKVIAVYFPDREKEGYGINKRALNFLSKFAPALLITVDSGITNFDEVKIAKEKRFEVIIIDHHETLGKIPEAQIVVDPKQKGDNYPFKQLAAAAVVFKVSEALLRGKGMKSLRKSFLELVALATIADMMPEIDENKRLIEDGLDSLKRTWRPGLKVFLGIYSNKTSSIRETAQKIISALNSGQTPLNIHESYLLLTSPSEKEAKKMADFLINQATEKRENLKSINDSLVIKVLKQTKKPIIFEGSPEWDVAILGSITSKLCNVFKKPTFIFKKFRTESQCAVRTPKGINGMEVLISCQKLLKSFGGHPQAAGFRVENKNLKKLENCLIKYFEEK